MNLKSVAVCTAALFLSGGSTAHANHAERQHYEHLYHQVAHRHGKRAPGRNIDKLGVKVGHHIRPATAHEVAVSIRQLRLLRLELMVPRPPALPPAGVSTARAYGVAACIRSHESTNNYHAVSPGGTYRGAYQFDYATFAAAGGHGDPAAASPGEQDAAFARWWPGHHNAWPLTSHMCGY